MNKQTWLAACLALASAAAVAVTPETKLAYNQAMEQAATAYKVARAGCDGISGNPRDVCIAEAKLARVRAEEEANAHYKDTLKAYTKARIDIANATYDLDKAKCKSLAGNDNDVCMAQAKSALVAAKADAKADKTAIEARSDARDDKRTAEYKVALEKCDAFAGAVKDNCVSAAKLKYGK
jgi:hypothetical protein